ncbi:monooxygenase [Calothrix sp. HK-06]|nr:monooxygenase [Calothrix sp. HK-06]
MQLTSRESQNYIAVSADLAQEFARTAIERDKKGGTPKYERERLRQSGLLKLIIPKEYGGLGESWSTALTIIQEFAYVDSSIAHLLGYHYLQVITPHLYGTSEQKENYYTWTVENNWFWGNALNPRDNRLVLTYNGENYWLNGIKSFCSGSSDSDMLTVSAFPKGESQPVVIAVPTRSHGVTVNHDWDNIGQRQTDSGSVSFSNVRVKKSEILASEFRSSSFASLRIYISHLVRVNILLGIALGAFEQAKQYTSTNKTSDAYILHSYGKLWTELSAVTSLTNQAADKFEIAWSKGIELQEIEFGEIALAISAASVLVTKVGLEVTSQIFELVGIEATAKQYGFDRYWRNLRTLTLHDPVTYKTREIGKWVLNGK